MSEEKLFFGAVKSNSAFAEAVDGDSRPYNEKMAKFRAALEPHYDHSGFKEDYFNHLNLRLIQEILQEEFTSGVYSADRKDIELPVFIPENVLFLTEQGFDSLDLPNTNAVNFRGINLTCINVDRTRRLIESNDELSPSAVFARLLFHELAHSTAAGSIEKTEAKSVLVSGTKQIDRESGNIKFNFLEEAIINARARLLAANYISRTDTLGEENPDVISLRDFYIAGGSDPEDMMGPLLIKYIAKRIAKEKDVPEDVVIKSFFHASLNGLNLANSTIVRDIDEIFGAGFAKALESFDGGDALNFFFSQGAFDDERFMALMHKHYDF